LRALAPVHLVPDILRADAGGGPKHGQIVKEIRALANDSIRLTIECIDDNLDGFLGDFFRHFRGPALKQPRSARRRGIKIPGGYHCPV
jgi:hypothetical protein